MSDDNLRARAILLVEAWWHADREAAVRPEHPLVVVQEMHLEAASERQAVAVRAGSTRRTAGSKPLIRDMPRHLRVMDGIMKHVWSVDPTWRKALDSYAEHGTVAKAAEARKMKTARLWRDFNNGVVVVQSELVRLGV